MSKRPQLSSKISVGRQQATPPRAPKLPEVDREEVIQQVQGMIDQGMSADMLIKIGDRAAAVIRDPKAGWPEYKKFMIEQGLETEKSLGAKPNLSEMTMYAVVGEVARTIQGNTTGMDQVSDSEFAQADAEMLAPIAPTGMPQ